MDMTKEYRAELRDLQMKLNGNAREFTTVKRKIGKALKNSKRQLTLELRALEKTRAKLQKEHAKVVKNLTKEHSGAARVHSRETKRIEQRIAIVEGRLS